MTRSHFVNAHGLTAEGHVMTARDIAMLSRALINQFPEHYALYKIKEFTYGGIQQWNRNGLLWKDASVDGLKTGHTSAAGYCLAASAKRGDQRLISVVLGIDTTAASEGFKAREEGNLALLNWGFRFFETHSVYDAGEQVADQPLWRGEAETVALGVAEPLLVTLPRGRYADLQPSMDVPKQLVAPITKGQQIGTRAPVARRQGRGRAAAGGAGRRRRGRLLQAHERRFLAVVGKRVTSHSRAPPGLATNCNPASPAGGSGGRQ